MGSRMPVKTIIHADLNMIQSTATDLILAQPIANFCSAEGILTGHSLSKIVQGQTHCELFKRCARIAILYITSSEPEGHKCSGMSFH